MAHKRASIYILFIFIILSACGAPSPQEKIYEHLEEAVSLESDFAKQQDEITSLEKQEQEISNQIDNLDMTKFDEIKKLSQQAIEVIEERAERLNIEQESINAAKQEFIKVDPLIDDLKEEKVKEKAKEMYNVMMDRYKAYDVLYDAYLRSLEEEEELYILYQDENTTEIEVNEQKATINNTYQEVLDSNEEFNANTVKYNDLKKEFYELANLNVKYDEG